MCEETAIQKICVILVNIKHQMNSQAEINANLIPNQEVIQ